MAGADVKCAYSTDLMAKFDKMRESFEAVVSEQAKVTIGNLLVSQLRPKHALA